MSESIRWILRTVWIAAVYFALGRPALELLELPGYASPIWPAAGFAVGVVLCYRYGYRACAGIFLGSFAVNFGTHPGADFVSIAIPLLIGLGAATQAAACRAALIRLLGDHTALKNIREMALFVLISGPVTCAVNGFIGPTVLRVFGVVENVEYLLHMLTWWGGDSVGAVMFAPATLALLNRNEPEWEHRAGLLAVCCVGALLLTAYLYLRQATYLDMLIWLVIVAGLNSGLTTFSYRFTRYGAFG